MSTLSLSREQFYSVNQPEEGELVIVNFISKNDIFFEAKLLEYDFKGIMNYNDATKKRRVTSWNKIVPLNKDMVVRVDEVDEKARIVQISLNYLDDGSNKEQNLLEKFTENKIFYNFVNSYCLQNELDFKDFWINNIHLIDENRRNDNCINDSLLKYFKSMNNFNDEISKLFEYYNLKYNNKSLKIISDFGIITLGSLNNVKELLNKVIKSKQFNKNIYYVSAPYYKLESNNDDSTENDHIDFIKLLETEGQKYNPKIFIKYVKTQII